MKVERNMCELCGDREARVFMVVCENQETAKAHVCLVCSEDFRGIPGRTVEAVSLQDYRETDEK